MTTFREEQCFRQPWLVGLMVLASLVMASSVLATGADSVGATVVAMGFFPAFSVWLFSSTLITEVRPEGLHVRFRLFWPERVIPFSQILKAESVTYRPIIDYGGWGVRGIPVKAFNVSGDRGVLLTLANGRTLMIGSQRPDQLAAALQSAAPRARASRPL